MNSNEQRIREFAYQIWQSEGKPHGQAKRHWEMACKLAESDVQQSASIASPKVKAASKKSTQTEETPAVAKSVKKTKTAEATPTVAVIKTDAVKKAKAKTPAAKAPVEKLETKKTAAVKKSKIVENQPT